MEVVQEYIRLLDQKPDVAEKLLKYHFQHNRVSDAEKMELAKLWSTKPNVAEKVLTGYSKYNRISDEVLIELVKLWLEGSISAGNFLENYDKQYGIESKTESFLIDCLQSDSKKVKNFLLNHGKRNVFCADSQMKLIDIFPNGTAIELMKNQEFFHKEILPQLMKIKEQYPKVVEGILQSMKNQTFFNEETLLELLGIWEQYPDLVSSILLRPRCLEKIFKCRNILSRILDFIEKEPNTVNELLKAYIQYEDLCYTDSREVMKKLLECVERGSKVASPMARDYLWVLAKLLPSYVYYDDLCRKIMYLFKEKPEDMYNIVLETVQTDHPDFIDVELIELWQNGSDTAYKLLLATDLFEESKVKFFFNIWRQGVPDKYQGILKPRPCDLGEVGTCAIFKLWKQGMPGAYEVLKAQGPRLFLGDKEQIELVNLLEQDSTEAYTLLLNKTFLCSEALGKLAQSKNPKAATILEKKLG